MADNSTKIVVSAEDRATGVLRDVERGLSGLTRPAALAAGALSGIGAALGGIQIAALVRESIDAADGFAKMAQKVGIGVESLTRLNYAASLSDVSTEQLGNGIKKLAKNMQDAGDGSKEAVQAFSRIGVAFNDSGGQLRGAEEVLRDIARVFATLPDGTQKTALAMELFGKAGADLIPLLNSGSAGLSQMGLEAERLGVVLNDDLVNAAQQFNDNMTRMSTIAAGFGYAIANDVLPWLNRLTNEFIEAKKQGIGLFEGMRQIGTRGTNPQTNIRNIDSELAKLQKYMAGDSDRENPTVAKAYDEKIAELKRARAYFVAMSASSGLSGAKIYDSRDLRPSADLQIKMLQRTGEAAKKAKKEVDEFVQVLNRINSKDAGLDASYWKDLQTLYAGYQKGRIGLEEYRAAVESLTNQQQFAMDIVSAAAKAEKEYADAAKKAADEIERSLQSVEDKAAAMEDEVATYGVAEGAIQRTIIARLDERKALYDGLDGYEAEIAAIEREIAARKRLAAAADAKDVKDAGKKAIEEQARAWQKFNDDIESSLTDALMRGFESGKDFGESFVASLKNTFKTTVLKVAVQAIVSPVTSGLQSVLGGGSAAGGIGGSLNAAASLGGLFGANTIAGTAGMGMYGSFATSALGQYLGLSATVPGLMGPTASGIALGSATGGATLTTVGAAMPYVAAALAVASLFMKDGGGPKSGGDAGYLSGVLQADAGLANVYTPNDQNASMAAALKAGLDGISATMRQIGGSGSLDGLYALGYDSDPQGTAGNRITSVAAGELLSLNRAAGDIQAGIADELNRMFIVAIQDSDVDAWAREMVAGIDPATASIESIAAAIANLDGMARLVPLFEAVGLSAGDLSQSLIGALGGYDAATAALTAYHDTIYSEQDRLDRLTQQVADSFTALSLTMPATREEFRSLAEGLDLTSEAGRTAFAALMSLAPAFVTVADAAKAAADAAIKAAEESAKAAAAAALSGVGTAFDTLSRAIDAARTPLLDSIDRYQEIADRAASISSALQSAIDSLQAQTVTPITVAAARGEVERMTSAARAGVMPDASAVARVTSTLVGDAASSYVSRTDYLRSQALSAQKLTDLNDLVKDQEDYAIDQIRLAEDQLTALDAQLATAQAQLDALKGIDTRVLSVEDALREFAAAIAATTAKTPAAYVPPAMQWAAPQYAPDTSKYSIEAIAAGVNQHMASGGSLMGVYEAALSTGVSSAQLSAATGVSVADIIKWVDENNLPHFAVGANYVPRDMTARIHVGERIIPAADNRELMRRLNDSSSVIDITPLIAEITALRAEVRAVANNTFETAHKWKRLKENNGALTVELAA